MRMAEIDFSTAICGCCYSTSSLWLSCCISMTSHRQPSPTQVNAQFRVRIKPLLCWYVDMYARIRDKSAFKLEVMQLYHALEDACNRTEVLFASQSGSTSTILCSF